MLSRFALSYALAALTLAVILIPQPVLAAETVVDFTSMLEPVVTAVIGVAGAAILWLARKAISAFQDRTDMELDEQLVNRLNMALFHAIKYGEGKALEALKGRAIRVDFKNELVAHAAKYAMTKVPDTLSYFNIDRDSLVDMIEARLEIDIDGDGNIGNQAPTVEGALIGSGGSGLGTAA